MRAFAIVVMLLLGAGAGVFFYLHETDQVEEAVDNMADFVVDSADRMRVPVQKALGHEPRPSKIIYLNREGAILSPGSDDARKNLSSILRLRGVDSHQVDGFTGSAKTFNTIAQCIAGKFDDFDVQVVTSRPVGAEYMMVMIGGRPGELKDPVAHKGVQLYGLSPSSAGPVEHAVVYVFAQELGNRASRICETAAHEIAHAYGLDHTRECSDLLSYMKPCRKSRTFADKDAPCGEKNARVCDDGAPTQNSHRRLLSLLGAKP